jgi:hypothetical protein
VDRRNFLERFFRMRQRPAPPPPRGGARSNSR